METISIEELNELYKDTIQRITNDLLLQDSELIEGELFEDFDSNVHSFLHESCLDRLYTENYLSKELKEISLFLRQKGLVALELEKTANFVKTSSEWKEIFDLASHLSCLKAEFDKNNKD